MSYKEMYQKWLEDEAYSEYHNELKLLKDEKDIEDRFYKNISFGTAGLRGKVGAGTNRMNIYNVSKATQGLANFIISKGESVINRGVVIAMDSRNDSKCFSETAAKVLAANGIKTYLFDDVRPTPVLSYAVRYLKTTAGIVVTASHNPPEYNGYKLYWDDGAQVNEEIADGVSNLIEKIKGPNEIKCMDFKEGVEQNLIVQTPKELDETYIEAVLDTKVQSNIDNSVSIVYTPLHGVGLRFVKEVLDRRGFKSLHIVEEQSKPDGNFPTVSYPNPEDPKSFKLAKELGEKTDAELLMATDPDSDRLGVLVRDNNGEYIRLNGNQTGSLLVYYILEGKKDMLPNNPVLIKTIVTSDQGADIAKQYGLEVIDTLTGFKNIAYELRIREGKVGYVFGYEESFGYMPSDVVRDKDGIMTCMLFAEMAGYYKKQNKTILDVLDEIYKKFGYYSEHLEAIVLEGIEGQRKIAKVMESFRDKCVEKIEDNDIAGVYDYLEAKYLNCNTNKYEDLDILKSNVLKYRYNENFWFAMRPSGTEPKLKIYFSAKSDNKEVSERNLVNMKNVVLKRVFDELGI
jgi:phosphomannomutase